MSLAALRSRPSRRWRPDEPTQPSELMALRLRVRVLEAECERLALELQVWEAAEVVEESRRQEWISKLEGVAGEMRAGP